ncbi:MAG: 50S ribosomal protein L1 [Candidatus Omnitrophica bacterium]|nr:50S ribosomal protein L1 [Candidatus Omnitrophota bacterium]
MSKRMKAVSAVVDRSKPFYSLKEAVGLIKQAPPVKFDQTVELSVDLDVDIKQTDQMVRGTVVLPHGTGKTVKILVFAKGDAERAAKEAGADYVGAEDLLAKVQGGWTDFDVVISTPDLMKEVGKLGKVLGPKGLMPSPKTGTVTPDVARAVQDAKRGKVEFKIDKQGDIHLGIGKLSFPPEAIEANGRSVLEAIWKARPPAVKGRYVKSVALSSTMGPGVKVDPAEGRPEL